MKTLDEVITALTICKNPDINRNCKDCPMPDTQKCIDALMEDALHYLEEYRETKKHLACLDDAEIRGDNTQVVNNPPLTWDELTQMDMQPVWYESLYWGVKTWAMVLVQKEGIYIDWCHRCQDGQIVKGNRCEIYKDQQGERWQAYRKKRHESTDSN